MEESDIEDIVKSEDPLVSLDDVGGYDSVKGNLKESVIIPLTSPELFKGKQQPCNGVLLYGPPGIGKTLLARALATEAVKLGATFYPLCSSHLVTKYIKNKERSGGHNQLGTTRIIKKLFNLAREKRPSIIFIDDMEVLSGCYSNNTSETLKIKTEFLEQSEGVKYDNTGVILIGATSMPWVLDHQIHTRFGKKLYLNLPEVTTRTEILKVLIRRSKHCITSEELIELGKLTEGFSGADISCLVRDALMQPVRKIQKATYFKKVNIPSKNDPNVIDTFLTPCSSEFPGAIKMDWTEVEIHNLLEPEMSMDDILTSLSTTKPTISEDEIKKHEDFTPS